jgi:hypothetical protein
LDLSIIHNSSGSRCVLEEELSQEPPINPLQPEHMDAAAIRRRYGPTLVLWGTVGRKTTFSSATEPQTRQGVNRRIDSLGRTGLVLCPAYEIDELDIPWANAAAFFQTVLYG